MSTKRATRLDRRQCWGSRRSAARLGLLAALGAGLIVLLAPLAEPFRAEQFRVARSVFVGSAFVGSRGLGVLAGNASSTAGAFPILGRRADRGSKNTTKHEARQVTGVVLEVEPTRIKLQSTNGETLTLTTFEDYTDRLATGAQVTAWYYAQDSGEDVLKSLDSPAEIFFVPVGEISRRVHRVILLPSSEVPDADGLYDGIREYLHSDLGWYLAPQYLADEVRQRAERAGSTLDAMDPATGRFNLSQYLGKTEGVIPKVASETHSDAVLEVRVLRAEAPVTRLVASWDGVEQGVAGPGMRTLARLSMFPHRGVVPAASVELKLWDAKGKLLWRNRRGLALLELLAGKGNRLRARPLPEFLSDTPALQAWLGAAFKSIAPETPPR